MHQVNLLQTQVRAEFLREALINRGAPPAKLTAVGYGRACPVQAGQDDAARAVNRRVTLRIVRPGAAAPAAPLVCPAAVDQGVRVTAADAVGPAAAASGDPGREPTPNEVKAAVAAADASVLFPAFSGCAEGEPTLERVAISGIRREGHRWVATVEGVIQSTARRLPAACFKEERQRKRWEALYGSRTSLQVLFRRPEAEGGKLKVVVP